MGKTFTQSGHRAFEQSQGRERNTLSVVTVPGFRRRSEYLGASASGFYWSDAGGSATPAPPSGVVVSDSSDPLTQKTLEHPLDYQGIFVTTLTDNAGSQSFGTPTLFDGIAAMPIGQVFRFRLRVWGVAMLANPWAGSPDPLVFTVGEGVFAKSGTVYDINTRYQFRMGNTPLVNAPHGVDVCLNAIQPGDAGSGDPKGLWRFDRVVTSYGTRAGGVFNPGWDMVIRGFGFPGGDYSNGIGISHLFPYAVETFRWHEPNPTLANPAPPFDLSLIPIADRPRASHLFDWRDLQFGAPENQQAIEWVSNGVGCYLIDYTEAASVLPTTYEDLVMEQISQVRS